MPARPPSRRLLQDPIGHGRPGLLQSRESNINKAEVEAEGGACVQHVQNGHSRLSDLRTDAVTGQNENFHMVALFKETS